MSSLEVASDAARMTAILTGAVRTVSAAGSITRTSRRINRGKENLLNAIDYVERASVGDVLPHSDIHKLRRQHDRLFAQADEMQREASQPSQGMKSASFTFTISRIKSAIWTPVRLNKEARDFEENTRSSEYAQTLRLKKNVPEEGNFVTFTYSLISVPSLYDGSSLEDGSERASNTTMWKLVRPTVLSNPDNGERYVGLETISLNKASSIALNEAIAQHPDDEEIDVPLSHKPYISIDLEEDPWIIDGSSLHRFICESPEE
ncbi:uncharacterized protein FIBRA_05334 [Fibroporia radiculosa]|uniref:Uncharacterized protein n=1 Tax=Fibroporia radiculosa TaxID=599839 RepID=J4GQT3_9APHY|nr:uncharacterized protein FIBRA_05334 [Fibroporia radiculosa]CCM03210.1 predicted protein [Fibroporia radiculosa]